ncbi:MAG TPA: hypothetical protein PLM33_04730, partial [Acidobacteriota bacterium]|nr:hypothetical protein [Acidobacteriota bacterium]
MRVNIGSFHTEVDLDLRGATPQFGQDGAVEFDPEGFEVTKLSVGSRDEFSIGERTLGKPTAHDLRLTGWDAQGSQGNPGCRRGRNGIKQLFYDAGVGFAPTREPNQGIKVKGHRVTGVDGASRGAKPSTQGRGLQLLSLLDLGSVQGPSQHGSPSVVQAQQMINRVRLRFQFQNGVRLTGEEFHQGAGVIDQ